MWQDLPTKQKQEYKKMILAFASLTDMFAQKQESDESNENVMPLPIINSKYQETVFQRVFNANAEDINNTSFDASLSQKQADGTTKKYLVGLKTFGLNAKSSQKVAQFKAYRDDWSGMLEQIKKGSVDEQGNTKDKKTIDADNKDLYLDLAKKISDVRNARIDSSIANLKGFSVDADSDNVEAVYHFLMPAKDDNQPAIHVGETDYTRIDINNISILGCTSPANPTNFSFTDQKHKYRYTSADSQLYMSFSDCSMEDKWDVRYADDAYAIFSQIANSIYSDDKKQEPPAAAGETDIDITGVDEEPEPVPEPEPSARPQITESYCWTITNNNGEVELFSGFNGFYGVGLKRGSEKTLPLVGKLRDKYRDVISEDVLTGICQQIEAYIRFEASKTPQKLQRLALRIQLEELMRTVDCSEFIEDVRKIVYRPKREMYIPFPNSREFHRTHPNFFAPGAVILHEDGSVDTSKEHPFNMVFEPSGTVIPCYITQSSGKGIESCDRQSILGDWILHGVFQLRDYEPLTAAALRRVGINGIRLYRTNQDDDVHLEFIWIDRQNPPADYRYDAE